MEKTKKSVEWQKVHIFISSTFNDMHAERDYLVKKVFPKLQDWCEIRKIRMVDIDLRWGVSETDTMNKKVVSTCLKNIDECRPFFICLLGQRRGWVPGNDDISTDTFKDYPEIGRYAGNTSVTEMEILHALIEPLHKTGSRIQEKSDEYYDPVKHAFFYLRDSSYLDSLPSTPDLLHKTYTNELIENVSERKTADDELETWREIKIPATRRPVRNYSAQWDADAETPDLRVPLASPSAEPQVLEQWKRLWKVAGIDLKDSDFSIPESLREEAERFNSSFTKGRLGGFKVESEDLSDVIFSDLTEAIRERFHEHIDIVEAESADETDLRKEIDQQEQFVALNSVSFIERTGDFDRLDAYAADDSRKLFVLTAPAGMGKSMFLAKWIDKCRTEVNPENNESIHFRFIGQSDKSTSFYNVWHSLLEEIREHTEKLEDEIIEDAAGEETRLEAILADPVKLHNSLFDILKKIGTKGKTIIVLDALNQLDTGLKDLNWLQSELPEGIKMIVSFKHDAEDTDAEKLYGRLKNSAVLSEIKPFESTEDRKKLIDKYLEQYLKELDQKHINALLEFETSKNPLFLKIVLNELRIFGAFLNIKDKISSDFGNSPLSAFEGVLKRLENDPAYSSIPPKVSVPLIFGLLANSRYGLSADELSQILFTTLGHESEDGNLDTIKETVYLYLRQVRPYLARKEGRYDYFYESFKIAALSRYANENPNYQISDFTQVLEQPDLKREVITVKRKDWHRLLAKHFRGAANPNAKMQWSKASRRSLSELAYHLLSGDELEQLYALYSNIAYVDARFRSQIQVDKIEPVEHTGVIEFLDELQRAAIIFIEHKSEWGELIGAITRLLIERSMMLVKFPENATQEIANYLDQYSKTTAAKALVAAARKRPIRLALSRMAVSKTLGGHCSKITTLAAAPSGHEFLSGAEDGTVGYWNVVEERPYWVVTAHQQEVTSIAISREGRYALTASSEDGVILLWNLTLASHRELMPLGRYAGHAWVGGFLNEETAVIGFASVVIVLDLVNGAILWRTWPPKDERSTARWALSPNMRAVCFGDYKLRLYPLDGSEPVQIADLTWPANQILFTQQGNVILVADNQGYVVVYSLEGSLLGKGFFKPPLKNWCHMPDGTVAASNLAGDLLRIYLPLPAMKVIRTPQESSTYESITALTPLPDGRVLAGHEDGAITLLDMTTCVASRTWVASMGFSAGTLIEDGSAVGIAGKRLQGECVIGSAMYFISPEACVERSASSIHSHYITGAATLEKRIVLTVDRSGTAVLWNKRKPVRVHNIGIDLLCCGAWVDGGVGVAGTSGGEVYLIGLGEEVHRIELSSRHGVSAVAAAGQPLQIIAALNNSEVVSAGQRQWRVRTGSGMGTAAAIDTSCHLAATGHSYGRIYLWNAVTGEEIFQTKLHTGPIFALAFGTNGLLYSAGADRSLFAIEAETGRVLSATVLASSPVAIRLGPDHQLQVFDTQGDLYLFAPGASSVESFRKLRSIWSKCFRNPVI